MTRPPAVYWDEPQAACLQLMPRPRWSASRQSRPPSIYRLAVRHQSVSRHQMVTEHRVNTLFDLAAVTSAAASPVARCLSFPCSVHCSRCHNQRRCCGSGWAWWWVPDYDREGCLLLTGGFRFRLSINNRFG